MRPDITRSMYVSLEKESNIDYLKMICLASSSFFPNVYVYVGNSGNESVERVLSCLCSANKGPHLRLSPNDTLKGKIKV